MNFQPTRQRAFSFKQRLTLCASVLLVAVLLSVPGAVGEAKARKVRLGFLPIADLIAYFAAKDRGFFKQEGIEIEASISRGSAVVIPAMEGGSLDVGWVDTMALSNAHLKGFDMQFIAPGGPIALKPRNVAYSYLARAKDVSISSMKDLRGKKVAMISFGGIAELGLRVLLAQAGVPYKSVTFLEIPFPKMTPALVAANTRMKEPLVKRIVQSRFEPTIRLTDVQPVIDAAAKHGLTRNHSRPERSSRTSCRCSSSSVCGLLVRGGASAGIAARGCVTGAGGGGSR